MLRWILLVALAVLVWLRLRSRVEGANAELLDPELATTPADDAVREMVADPMCGAFVAKQSALTSIGGGQIWYFCSPDCYRRFLFENRRAAGQ